MTGSRGSASNDPERILICGVNWVGDSVMSMPAIQAYATSHPETRIEMLVKPGLVALWRMHPEIAGVLQLEAGWGGVRGAARSIRATGTRRAYVFPHSFRAALPAFLARVPERVGMPGHSRDFMLTRVVRPRTGPGRLHQQFEYADLLLPGEDVSLPAPELRIPPEATTQVEEMLNGEMDWIGLIPGAARGPAKQWPAEHVADVGRRLVADAGVRVAVIGAPSEGSLCESITARIGERAVNLAGRLSFATWAAALLHCRVVVANDSGGMHLAAALGTPVVALFGHTDPDRTGPLGPARVLQNSPIRHREVARNSAAARLSLASIQPGDVYDAVRALAGGG